jgi:hypothetical protein
MSGSIFEPASLVPLHPLTRPDSCFSNNTGLGCKHSSTGSRESCTKRGTKHLAIVACPQVAPLCIIGCVYLLGINHFQIHLQQPALHLQLLHSLLPHNILDWCVPAMERLATAFHSTCACFLLQKEGPAYQLLELFSTTSGAVNSPSTNRDRGESLCML